MDSNPKIVHLRDIINRMMEKKRITEYKVEYEGETGNGDGYLGDITFFSIITKNGKKQNFVSKAAKTNKIVREMVYEDEIYDREIYMYSFVFPTLQLFVEAKKLNGFLNFIPKACYISRTLNQEMIILENLKYQNYDLWDRKKPMDLSHIKLVFENYGKWHGVTMAYREIFPERSSEMEKKLCKDLKSTMVDSFDLQKYYFEEFSIMLEMLELRGRDDLVEIYRRFEHQLEDVVIRRRKEDSLCIIHADCWIANYLFKYSKNGQLTQQMSFLDFQLCMFDSPVIDLSCFFYNVADKSAYDNFDEILAVYFNSLTATLRDLGSGPENLFKITDLKRHWQKYAFYGVLTSIIHIKLELCEADEAPNLSKMVEDGESIMGIFGFQIKDMETVRSRALDGFIHFGEFLKLQDLCNDS